MSTSTSIAYDAQPVAFSARAAAYVELTKPRITALVLLTVAAAMLITAPVPPDVWLMVHALLGTALVGASTSALNQWLERGLDARMPRTAGRAIPSGRLSPREVLIFGMATLVVGLVYLTVAVNLRTAIVGLVAWWLYVWVYTPLKTRTPLNTAVGAVGGALPVVMGWAATGAPAGLEVGTLFVMVYLWQFPHFMAIAWLYRADYARAGMRMATVVDPTGHAAGRQALRASLALVPVALLPAMISLGGGPIYFGWGLVLGIAYVAASVRFAVRRDDTSARALLRTSLIYLPGLLVLWTMVVLN